MTTPRPKLRASGTAADQRPPAPAEAPAGDRAGGRNVPVRAWLLAGLALLLLLAVFRPGGAAAVVGIPLAIVLPGAVLQPRFLPRLSTDPVTRWCLRGALSLAVWALVGLAVGAAGVPLRSVWPVLVAVLLLAAVVVGDAEGERRFGVVSLRATAWGALALVVATLLALGARGLVAVAGGAGGHEATHSVLLAVADPTVPIALAPTGASATVEVVVTNTGSDDLTLTLGGRVGRMLPWPSVTVALPAGATRTVQVGGGVPVCSNPQQAVVTVEGAGDVAPLSMVVPGAAGGIACGSG